MSDDVPYKERDRKDVLSFMTSLWTATGNMKEAEGSLLELLAFCAFPKDAATLAVAS